jgi:hypothetical protein
MVRSTPGLGSSFTPITRPRRPVRAQLLDVGRVHRLEVGHPIEEDVDVHDVLQVGAHRLEFWGTRRVAPSPKS